MKKVLVVDDDIVMFRLFQVQVKRAGCEGFFFRNATSALEEFEHIQPDLAVLDYRLPDLNGAELHRRIRALKGGANIPIIFVSGAVQEEDLQEMRALQPAALLSKPFSPRKLQKIIQELLGIE